MKKLFELINRNVLTSKMADFISHESKGAKHPIITISREFGAGGSIVAKKVALKLGKDWKIYHKEIVEEIAREANLEKKLIREVDERHVPLIDELADDFFGRRYLSLHSYARHLLKILSVIGLRGNAIIIGRGAHFLFPGALKVRVIADINYRVQTIVKYEKVSEKRAIALVNKKDNDRNEFNRSLYKQNQHKAHHYDAVIKLSENLTIDDAVKIIVDLAKRRFKQ